MNDNLKEKVYVSYGDFIVQSILNESTRADDVFTPHWHESFEILQIYERELVIDYGDEHFIATPGDIVIFGANQLHGGRSGVNGCLYRALQFKWSELLGETPFERKLLADMMEGAYRFQSKIHDSTANELFNSVVEAHDRATIVQPIAEKGELCRLVTYLMQNYMSKDFFFSSTDTKFSSLLDYIKQHFTENLTTENIADTFSYSKAHLCRKFKKNTGMPLTDYIHMCRIEYAQQLIKENNLDLSEIATRCGYNSYSYFSRVFSKMATISPAEWRSRFVKTNFSEN